MIFKTFVLSCFVMLALCQTFEEDGSGGDFDDHEIASGDILQDDLLLGPDGSEIRRVFVNLGSGDSVEGSFDPRDQIIEIAHIKGSNKKEIRRTQVVQPGIHPEAFEQDDGSGSGMPSGKIIENDISLGPDGSKVQRIFMNLGSGDSVEGSFDPRDEIIEIDDIKGSNGAEIHRTQVVQAGEDRGGRFRRQATPDVTEGSGSEEEPKCIGAGSCEDDADCNGGKCVGFLPGTCNCNACFDFLFCTSDAGCGGLQGACNNVTKLCSCSKALTAHGVTPLTKFTQFCNVKKCKAGECLGLPCNKGFCSCPPKKP